MVDLSGAGCPTTSYGLVVSSNVTVGSLTIQSTIKATTGCFSYLVVRPGAILSAATVNVQANTLLGISANATVSASTKFSVASSGTVQGYGTIVSPNALIQGRLEPGRFMGRGCCLMYAWNDVIMYEAGKLTFVGSTTFSASASLWMKTKDNATTYDVLAFDKVAFSSVLPIYVSWDCKTRKPKKERIFHK